MTWVLQIDQPGEYQPAYLQYPHWAFKPQPTPLQMPATPAEPSVWPMIDLVAARIKGLSSSRCLPKVLFLSSLGDGWLNIVTGRNKGILTWVASHLHVGRQTNKLMKQTSRLGRLCRISRKIRILQGECLCLTPGWNLLRSYPFWHGLLVVLLPSTCGL